MLPFRRRMASSPQEDEEELMETEHPKRTVKIAVVELSTLEEMRAFFGGAAVNAKVAELPAEELEQPARILPFRKREQPPLKAA